jgi:hypothetical protein
LKGAPYNLETFKDLNEEELEDIDSDYSDDESVRIAQRIKAGRKLNSLKIEDDESQTFFCGEVCHIRSEKYHQLYRQLFCIATLSV